MPRPSTEPITVQRQASNTGVLMVAGRTILIEGGTAIRVCCRRRIAHIYDPLYLGP